MSLLQIGSSPARITVATTWALLAALVVAPAVHHPLAAALGSGPGGALAAGLALVAASLVGTWSFRRALAAPPPELDQGGGRGRVFRAVVALLLLVTVVATGRLAIYIDDPTQTQDSVIPVPSLVHHSCLTAYAYAADLSRRGEENLYEAGWYPDTAQGSLTAPQDLTQFEPFTVDAYAYPPPFLLLPRLLQPLAVDYASLRALWFGLSGLVLLEALWRVARWVGSVEAHVLSLVAWGLPATMVALQAGNAHALVVALAVLAMLMFEDRRPALGGAMLSFAVLAKISPGLLGVYLLLRRRWADAAWTALFGAVWVLLGVAVLGTAPYLAFVHYELPRLSSGAALSFMSADLMNTAVNMGPFGLPFKAQILGMDLDPWPAARTIGSIYTVITVALTVLVTCRVRTRLGAACAWLAILALAGLRSPFAPGYVNIPVLWAMALLAQGWRTPRAIGTAVAAVVLISIALPFLPPKLIIVSSLVTQLTVYAVTLWVALYPQGRGQDLARPERLTPSAGPPAAPPG